MYAAQLLYKIEESDWHGDEEEIVEQPVDERIRIQELGEIRFFEQPASYEYRKVAKRTERMIVAHLLAENKRNAQ